MNSVINLGSQNYWASFKHLRQLISNVIEGKERCNHFELESLLRRHKSDFLSLLKNQPRNSLHRQAIIEASKTGITVIQNKNKCKTIIPQVMVDEALLLSEMFDLNELIALELIITGENQEPRYPGMTRGPIAVLIYYDSKKCLVNSLKFLIQARGGRSWTIKLKREITKVITSFTNELKEECIVLQCLDHLKHVDINAEMEVLQKNKALGPGKYKKQIYELIKEINHTVAEIVFGFSAQMQFNSTEVSKTLDLLATKAELDSTGCLNFSSTSLLMAILYNIDVTIIQNCDENDPILDFVPLVKNPSLIQLFQNKLNSIKFSVDGIDLIINFALSLSMKTLNVYPINEFESTEWEDEKLIDSTIENHVFEYLKKLLAENKHMHSEEFYLRQLYNITSNFIFLMPLKIKELRNKGDESGRIFEAYAAEGIKPPPSLPRHFENLLYLLSELYAHDTFNLSTEIWKSIGDEKQVTPRSISLFNFLRSTLDSFLPQNLHIPLLKLLKHLSAQCPFNVFNLLKTSGISSNSYFTIDHFFTLFHQYYSTLKGSHKTLNIIISGPQNQITGFSGSSVTLTSLELEIYTSILELLETIVEKDRSCCIAIADNQQYSCISTFIGLLMSPIPRKLKAAILCALGGFAKSSSAVALNIWMKLDSILPKSQMSVSASYTSIHQQSLWGCGIAVEIEDIEPKNEEYPITIGFLKALNSIFSHIGQNKQPQQQTSIESCLNFIINALVLKVDSRIFKFEEEKWIIVKTCLEFFQNLLNIYDPINDGIYIKGAFFLMSQILQETPFFRFFLRIIEEGVNRFNPDSSTTHLNSREIDRHLKNCLLLSLEVFNLVGSKEDDYLSLLHEIPGFPSAILVKLSTLFFNINPSTGLVDRLALLVKVVNIPKENNQIEALKLLGKLVSSDFETSKQLLMQIQLLNGFHEDYSTHGFVECLQSENSDLRLSVLNFILLCLKSDIHCGSRFGFAHKLLGFSPNKHILNLPGTMGQTFNCFHAIVCLLELEDENLYKERCVCMQIIYTLCSEPVAFDPDVILRFLRSGYDFLVNFLNTLEKKKSSNNKLWLDERFIEEVSWFLKILATEIKNSAQQNLKSSCNNYIKLLIGENANKQLLDLVPDFIFTHDHPEMPKWEFFEVNELWNTISECCQDFTTGFIDVKALHKKLLNEVKLVGPQLGVVQTGLIQNEIKQILNFVTSLNNSQECLQLKINYFDSWRELAEIIICLDCFDFLGDSIKSRVILEIIFELLQKPSEPETTQRLLIPISSVVLMSCAALQRSGVTLASNTNLLTTAKTIMNILEASSSASLWSKYKRARVNFYGALLYVYRMLPHALFTDIRLNYRLLERIFKDVLSSHEITKILAMAVISQNDLKWVTDLASDGSLKILIDSLIVDDKEIKSSKNQIECRSFYSFDSKIALFMRMASSPYEARILLEADMVNALANLECIEMYPYMSAQKEISQKIFINVLRLLSVLCSTTQEKNMEELSKFLSVQGSLIQDILRLAPSFDDKNGQTVLLLTTGFVSQLINHSSQQLQRVFVGLISYFGMNFKGNEMILVNLLRGCVKLSKSNGLSPLFAPSWDYRTNSFGAQPSLGSLIQILDIAVENVHDSNKYNKIIIEFCLYLLWHHLNLYFILLEVPSELQHEVSKLQENASNIISDTFLSKIQTVISSNMFIDALSRRIKRLIRMKI